MKKEEAINILRQVCSTFRGTLQEHQQIQMALKVVCDEPKEQPKEEPKAE